MLLSGMYIVAAYNSRPTFSLSSENKTFLGGEEYLKQRGIEVVVLDNSECKELMDKFIAKYPAEWYDLMTQACWLREADLKQE